MSLILALVCGSPPAGAQESPVFREIFMRPAPAFVALAFAPRVAKPVAAPDAELSGDFAPPAIATLAPTFAAPLDDRDLAFDLLGDEQRALALALDDWRRAVRGADRKRLRAAIAEAYSERDYEPFWREGPLFGEAARAVTKRLRASSEDGLDLRAYKIPAPGTAAQDQDELALSEVVVAYATQASVGRVDPERVSRLIRASQTPPAAGETLTKLSALRDRAGDALRDYNPPHKGYELLREKLAELRAHRSADADALAEAERFGDTSSDPPASADGAARRRRLAGDAGSRSPLEGEILANMERWRWLPRDLGASRIEVNIPEFELVVIRDGVAIHRARVIVGKEQTPTPIFSNAMQSVIVNPSWNVPQSIILKELLPKHGGDLSGLAARGWKVRWTHGKLSVRQPPGEANALGRVKFIFPNDFAVYMHDTPSRGLFSAARRAFSHGCMRVEDPFALAVAVLGPDSGWSEERVRGLVGSSERYINLARPLPIHIEYFTAYVDERGRLKLREDLYGYSARVRRELGLGG